jgi:hemoglobin|tara:strand:- start:1266 stop:1631 length:366 start_codon:yes stop_codon:yes gene_type:complete
MKDITTREDIELMVDTFYDEVRKDELLGPIFNSVIKDGWSKHLKTMSDFWQTVLFHQIAYKGSPFPHHRELPIDAQHFERWILHFNNSINKNFEGKIAEDAKWRASKMAEMFMYKLSSNRF